MLTHTDSIHRTHPAAIRAHLSFDMKGRLPGFRIAFHFRFEITSNESALETTTYKGSNYAPFEI